MAYGFPLQVYLVFYLLLPLTNLPKQSLLLLNLIGTFPLGNLSWKVVLGIVFVLISAWVILGGLQKIVKVTSRLVPIMVVLYFSMGVFILMTNLNAIGPALSSIFTEAFNLNTAFTGGFWGLIFLGIRRAVFSNESGVGKRPNVSWSVRNKRTLARRFSRRTRGLYSILF